MTKPVLDERIKVWADKIYQSDRQKFQRLVKWISAAERTYDVEVIAGALERFLPIAATSRNWWGHLDWFLENEEGRRHGSDAEEESNRHKTEVGELAEALLNGVRSRAKAR